MTNLDIFYRLFLVRKDKKLERKTKPRKMIIDCLNNLHHASFDDIFSYLEENNGFNKISLSTFYRNISFLEQDGVIRKVDSTISEPFYELSNIAKHDHFICIKCHKIIDIPRKNRKEKYDEYGNLIQEISINEYGICKDCLDKIKI